MKKKHAKKRKKPAQGKRASLPKQQLLQKESLPETPMIASRQRLWAFRLAAIVVMPALMLIALEAGLRLFGYGVPAGFTFKQEIDGQTQVLSNPYFTWRFFAPQLARDLSHFALPLRKPAGTYRIFVLGGSAAMGTPEPAYGIARMLEVMLRDQYPDVKFEIINAAITAINSHVVLPIARNCSRLESDLFVVYLGNNEVVGPYGAGTVFSPLVSSLPMIRASIVLKGTRLGQLLSGIIGKLGRNPHHIGRWRGMEMFLGNQVRAADPGMATVYGHFEKNLTDICRVAEKSGIPVIVSTVSTNLKDCAPFGSLHRFGLSTQEIQKWEAWVRDGNTLRKKGQLVQAVELYLRAENIDPDYAELQYRLGNCYWELWDFVKAKKHFIRARELDTLRFRADTRINTIIKQVAEEKSGQGIHFVDSLKTLEGNSPEQTPGNELFYEHVHLNFRGTYLVSREIYKTLQNVLPDWIVRSASGRPVLTEQACAQRLAYTGWNRLAIAKRLLDQMKKPPFAGRIYNNKHVTRLSAETKALQAQYARPEHQQAVLAHYKAALENDAPHWRLHKGLAEFYFKGLNDAKNAEKQLRAAIRQCPQSSVELSLLGEMLAAQEKHGKAADAYRRALKYNPRSAVMLFNFGFMLMEQGKIPQAIRYLTASVEIDPTNPVAQSNLGVALGRSDDAVHRRLALEHLKEAVEIDPSLVGARLNLARHYSNEAMDLVLRGENDRAREYLQHVVALAPDAVPERYSLAVLLFKGGDYSGAKSHLSEILRIAPGHLKARKLFQQLK